MKTKEKNEIINKKDKIINKEEGRVGVKTQNKETKNNIDMIEYNGYHIDLKIQEKQNLLKDEQQALNDEIESIWEGFGDDEEETLTEETEVRSGEIKTNNGITDSFVEKLNGGRNKDKETEVGI